MLRGKPSVSGAAEYRTDHTHAGDGAQNVSISREGWYELLLLVAGNLRTDRDQIPRLVSNPKFGAPSAQALPQHRRRAHKYDRRGRRTITSIFCAPAFPRRRDCGPPEVRSAQHFELLRSANAHHAGGHPDDDYVITEMPARRAAPESRERGSRDTTAVQ